MILSYVNKPETFVQIDSFFLTVTQVTVLSWRFPLCLRFTILEFSENVSTNLCYWNSPSFVKSEPLYHVPFLHWDLISEIKTRFWCNWIILRSFCHATVEKLTHIVHRFVGAPKRSVRFLPPPGMTTVWASASNVGNVGTCSLFWFQLAQVSCSFLFQTLCLFPGQPPSSQRPTICNVW